MLIVDQLKKNDPQLRTLTLGVLLGMCILVAGLWYLQIVSARKWEESLKDQSFRTVRVPALRGQILDRNGIVLAENRPSYNINLYVEELRKQFQQQYAEAIRGRKLSRSQKSQIGAGTQYQVVSNIVQQLGSVLKMPLELDEKRFSRHFRESLAMPMPVIEDLSPEQVARFEEQPDRIPGLNLEIQPLRFYPYRTLASHLLGYLLQDNNNREEEELFYRYRLPDYKGIVGIEGAFDAALRGKAGAKSLLINNLGYRQSETVWIPHQPGDNLILTIDARIQKAAERALQSFAAEVRGSVVVMDPRNGDILALVSSPSYDPNLFIPRISHETWQSLNDPVLKPQLNRTTFASYAPGSIFKIVVALAGLESGDIDPNEIFHNVGHYYVGKRPFNDTAPPGDYNFKRAFMKSSNSYFIHYGLKMGWTNIMNMGARLFLGQPVDVPLMQEVNGFFPTPEWLKRKSDRRDPLRSGDIANLCIGHGYITVTPLQMAVMTSAVANGGKVFWPRLVDRIEPRDTSATSSYGQRLKQPGQLRGELGVKLSSLNIVREAMLADVEDAEGTGTEASVEGFRVCGKTGTAEDKQLNRKDTWFASFAPYESPRYVVLVMIENGGSGGKSCAPVARRIYQEIKRLESQPVTAPITLAGY